MLQNSEITYYSSCDLSGGMCTKQACKGKEPKRALTENIQTYDLLPELLQQ